MTDRDDRDVTAISGIGERRAEALDEAGFETVGDMRAADPASLTDATGIGESRANTLMTTVEEMETAAEPEDSADAPSSETDADSESTAADTGTETATTASASSTENGADTDQRGPIARVKDTVTATLGSPQADADKTDLTHIATVRPQKAAALHEADFETIGDIARADQPALVAVEGVDETNARYLQNAAAQLIETSPGDAEEIEDTDAEGSGGVEDTDDDEHGHAPQTEPHGKHTAATDTTADDSNAAEAGIATKSAGAVKTAARAVVNPASVIQDDGVSAAENGDQPTADDDQQLGDEAIAEIADTANVSPSKARELIQNATENESVGLTADQSAATASVTTENSDMEETYAADLIAPASLRLSPSSSQTSNVHTKTIYVEGYPEYAETKMFEQLFAESDNVDVDMSIHVGSHDRLDAIGHLRDAIEDLQVRVAQKDDESDVTLRDTARRLEGHEDVYDTLSTGKDEAFDVGFYIILRGNTESSVEDAADTIETKLKTKQLTVKPADYAQQDGLMAGSPVGADRLERTTTMMGGAVGSMYPFSSTSLIEPSGVLMGYHALTDSPIVMDRYQRSNYNMIVAGELGAGKSFNTKLMLLRMLARDPETIVIIIDPRGEFSDLVDTLGGNRIAVGGTSPINPLEIEATPEHVRAGMDTNEYNPFRQGRSSAMDIFDSYFQMNSTAGEGGLSAERRSVLGFAFDVTYAMCGFTTDPATHTNQSPIIPDVRSVLGAINRNPEPFIRLSNRPLQVTPEVVDELPGIDVANRRVTAGSSPENAPLTALPEIAESHADQLADAGIDTLGDLSESDPPTVARAADVRLSEADEWLEQAVTPGAYTPASTADTTAAAPDGGTSPAGTPAWMDDNEEIDIADQTVEDWENHASGLKIALAPFRPGGALGHLGQPTDIDISDANVTLLDFQAADTETEMSLMTKVLFNAIYERAKTSDKRIVLPIDEAWRLIKNSESLTWLQQGTRFSRHHDLSIQFITQTLDEFYDREDAKFILDNSATKLLHNLDGGLSDEQANHLKLTEREASYVNNATMGETGAGYSEALLMVKEEGKYPLRVEALSEEVPLIDPEAAEEMDIAANGGYT
ncbi:helix-hairpin-helix domain-containing protein [Halococcus sp. AFM35]|uniref:VirB4 family type IV secretion system protein n=1 Tax=Halococcus sp. AFM35 TaxID=3421653 RepID=UPI003EBD8024